MGRITDQQLDVFKDMNGLHDFTDAELKQIDNIAKRLKKLLTDSKQREQNRLKRQQG